MTKSPPTRRARPKNAKEDKPAYNRYKAQWALQGIGKPELLKHNKSGVYSRRIDEANRLIYGIDEAIRRRATLDTADEAEAE